MMSRITLNLRKSVSKVYTDKIPPNPNRTFPGAGNNISVGPGISSRFAPPMNAPTTTNHADFQTSVGPPRRLPGKTSTYPSPMYILPEVIHITK